MRFAQQYIAPRDVFQTLCSSGFAPASSLTEAVQVPPPSEQEMQALWFEGLFTPSMTTEEGEAIEILQPGDWNHGPGPDFSRAAFRDAQGRLHTGPAELHLRPRDWDAHGHHLDPAYNRTVLHVVWAAPGPRYYPATAAFRCVRQIILSKHLPAPWPELRPHVRAKLRRIRQRKQRLPRAQAGRCSPPLAAWSRPERLALVRAAGEERLRRKAQRLSWAAHLHSPRQALWEALVEGLGYGGNQLAFRTLAQRLPASRLARLPLDHANALVFGLSGFLPRASWHQLPASTRRWARPLWESWWRERGSWSHAQLRPEHWRRSGLRPANRPERRLALLAHWARFLPRFLTAVEAQDDASFAQLLAHSFPRAKIRLGTQRQQDILLNVFWPWVARQDPARATDGWQKARMAPNQKTSTAQARILGSTRLSPQEAKEALLQQGLLHLFEDFCVAEGCATCSLARQLERLDAK